MSLRMKQRWYNRAESEIKPIQEIREVYNFMENRPISDIMQRRPETQQKGSQRTNEISFKQTKDFFLQEQPLKIRMKDIIVNSRSPKRAIKPKQNYEDVQNQKFYNELKGKQNELKL